MSNLKDKIQTIRKLVGGEKALPPVSRLDMSFKDVTKRMPELQQAAKLYEQGKITREEYYAIVDQLKPVTPYEFIPKPATAEEALAALTSDKVKDFGRTDVLTPGETILSRLDIPAYSKKGTWVTSQHRLKPPADEPKTIYTPTMMLEGETKMMPGTGAARRVAKGEKQKSSFATIRGAYKPGSDEEAVERAIEALRSKDYAQIGYDPERRGFFYDRKTMEPIIGTEEGIIQIGPLVLGKKPIRGNPEDFEYKDGGAVHMQDGGKLQMAAGGALNMQNNRKVRISDNPDTMLLELTRAPRMQEGGKPPPGVRRAMAQQRGTVAPIPGIKTPAEFIGGYVGADPRFSVMDPDADALERAYRAGEATSVIGDIAGAISPFATASTLARANALPGAAVVKAGAKKPPNVMAEFEKALAQSGPPTPAQIKKADAAEERVKKEKKFAKLRPSEQRQAIEAARSEALGTTVDRSSKVLKALLPGEEDIMTSLQGIKGYEVAKAVPAYAVKEAKVKRAKLREEPPTTPGASASEKEWQDWGKQFGVDMTLSKPVSLGISDPVAKREVKIPGGLEGTFTIPDMFWMKANNVNPAALPKDVHDKLMLKFVRTHTVAEPDEVDIFNRLNFALLSPNAPLTSNEFLAMRARIRDKDELERLAARSGEEGLSKKMAEELGVQSGAKGGMGVLGTADLANQAELARMILQKPEMFMIQPGETMRDVTMRVMNQVPGLGPKTASLATPWLDLERANTSAVDLHMIRDATPRLLTDPDVGPAFRARMGKLLGVEPTMEAILAQPPNKVQEKAVQIVGGSDVSKVYRTKTGALNEIPEAALPEKLVYEPGALSNFNPFYSKVVEYVDESRGANPVLELFPEQWRKWDVIRGRIEPHEFAHPDYRKLPKQSFSEMKAASDEHTAAGYRGPRPVMDETDWRKLYYGSLAPIGVGLGAGALSEMDTGTD